MGHILHGYQRNDRDQIVAKAMDSDQLTKDPSNPQEHWWDSPDKVPHTDLRINERHPDVLNGIARPKSSNSEIEAMREQMAVMQKTIDRLSTPVKQPQRSAPAA